MEERLRASFGNKLFPISVRRDAYTCPKKGDDKIWTYVAAVSHLLKSYATNANIARATSEVGQLVKLSNVSAVQFADAGRPKAVKCGRAYLDERTKKAFIDGLPLSIHSGV